MRPKIRPRSRADHVQIMCRGALPEMLKFRLGQGLENNAAPAKQDGRVGKSQVTVKYW